MGQDFCQCAVDPRFILIAFVLLVPKGLVPTLGDLGQWLLSSRGKRAKTRLEPKQAEEG